MRVAFGRVFIGVVLLALNFSCTDNASSDPCGGGGCMAWGEGEPHPTTETSGGTSSKFDGQVTLPYSQVTSVQNCSVDSGCTWSGGRVVTVTGTVPIGWTGLDAGTADAGADATDADAADADAADADAPIGIPFGWGAVGDVAVIDLGKTDLNAASPLVDARIIFCNDPYETLVNGVHVADGGGTATGSDALDTSPSATYVCLSAGLQPARIEALVGAITMTSSKDGDTTTSTKQLDASSKSGVVIRLDLSTTSAPFTSWEETDCY